MYSEQQQERDLDFSVLIAYMTLGNGQMRGVFEYPGGPQYVIDADGNEVYGVWYLRPDQAELVPNIEDTRC